MHQELQNAPSLLKCRSKHADTKAEATLQLEKHDYSSNEAPHFLCKYVGIRVTTNTLQNLK